MEIRKAFKFRIYPNQTQQAELARQFGHSRFVYNRYLNLRKTIYLETSKTLNYVMCANDMAQLKKSDEFPWLKEADSQVLQQSLKDLDAAYQRFFDHAKKGTLPIGGKPRKDGMPKGYPSFHSKHDRQSIRYPQRFKLNDKRVYLPKVGWVKGIFHRPIEGKMKNCTVSKNKSGRYFVSIQVEMEIQDPTPRPEAVGLDLGLTTFAALSTGEKLEKPKHLHRSQRRLKIRQRRLSRKVKGSKRRRAVRLPLAKLHERVANQRKDFQHKLSRELVNRFGSISFESLNVAGMVKNHNLARAISDASWAQFVQFCEYKAAWSSTQVLRVDRFFPSSKLCSDCGHKNKSLTLNLRQWACLNCGSVHDRDTNAAINILNNATTVATTTVGATESYATGEMSGACKLFSPSEAQRL